MPGMLQYVSISISILFIFSFMVLYEITLFYVLVRLRISMSSLCCFRIQYECDCTKECCSAMLICVRMLHTTYFVALIFSVMIREMSLLLQFLFSMRINLFA